MNMNFLITEATKLRINSNLRITKECQTKITLPVRSCAFVWLVSSLLNKTTLQATYKFCFCWTFELFILGKMPCIFFLIYFCALYGLSIYVQNKTIVLRRRATLLWQQHMLKMLYSGMFHLKGKMKCSCIIYVNVLALTEWSLVTWNARSASEERQQVFSHQCKLLFIQTL